jgi:hypothetical protein
LGKRGPRPLLNLPKQPLSTPRFFYNVLRSV